MTEQFLPQANLRCREYDGIARRCQDIRIVRNKGELTTILAKEVLHYSMFDLQVIGCTMRNEIRKLPSPYREAVGPYFIDQIFGMHHHLLTHFWDGNLSRVRAPITNQDLFDRFCEMVPCGCCAWDEGSEKRLTLNQPLYRFFYYLVSCYAIFVLERPGHPVGMPFPGSFRIEEKEGIFLCPIRDKEKDVFYSICNFCPAQQKDMP